MVAEVNLHGATALKRITQHEGGHRPVAFVCNYVRHLACLPDGNLQGISGSVVPEGANPHNDVLARKPDRAHIDCAGDLAAFAEPPLIVGSDRVEFLESSLAGLEFLVQGL
jgi:hypothetical protein